MTLIELLVSIVILVTVLGAVIPVISPNNDARRIRNGARQLQTMLAQAQALAAREGRPYGVAFKEIGVDTDGDGTFDTGDGTALEVYYISEPKPYTGFSQYSRVRMTLPSPGGNGPNDPVLMQFVLAGPPTGQPFPADMVEDQFPPNLIRRGDRIEVGGVVYRMIDPDQLGNDNPVDQPTEEIDFVQGEYYTLEGLQPNQTWLCVPERARPPLPIYANGFTTPRSYKFLRQTSNPATRPGNTSAPPLVMPRGVAIDMVASGTDVIFPDPLVALTPQCGLTTLQSAKQTAFANPAGDFKPFVRPLTVGVLFAPSGRVDSITVNGEKLSGSPDHLYLLVGRAENSLRSGDEKVTDTDMSTVADDGELLERRQRLNWLNGDSMWVTIAGNSGRILTSDNDISTDPRSYLNNTDPSVIRQLAWQIRDAREFAQEMSTPARQ